MLRIKTVLTKLVGKGDTTHWRQFTVSVDSASEAYYLRTYYGRALKSIKLLKQFTFDNRALAMYQLDCAVRERTEAGYQTIELINEDVFAAELADIDPPALYKVTSEKALHELVCSENILAFPVVKGERTYIKIGCESITSVSAKNSFNQDVELHDLLVDQLKQVIQLGKWEQLIIEGYVVENALMITDALSINGVLDTRAYPERLKFLKKLSRNQTALSVCRAKRPSTTILEPKPGKSDASLYHIAKDVSLPCINTTKASGYIIPTFYTLNVEVSHIINNRNDGKTETMYSYGLYDNNAIFQELGSIALPKHLSVGVIIKINFNGIEDGQLASPWLAPDFESPVENLPPSSFVLNDLEALWSCNDQTTKVPLKTTKESTDENSFDGFGAFGNW